VSHFLCLWNDKIKDTRRCFIKNVSKVLSQPRKPLSCSRRWSRNHEIHFRVHGGGLATMKTTFMFTAAFSQPRKPLSCSRRYSRNHENHFRVHLSTLATTKTTFVFTTVVSQPRKITTSARRHFSA
jgi:hypothetical protein